MSGDLDRLQRRAERERLARKEAERLLEEKSMALYLANEALLKELIRNKQYLDTMQTLMVALDEEGKVTMVNRKGCEMLGYQESELIGKNWFMTCQPQPAGMYRIFPEFRRFVTGATNNFDNDESAVLCRDGRERLVAWHHALLTDESGKIFGALSSGEDITERKKTEAELHKLFQAVEQSSESIVITDVEQRIEYVNEAFIRASGYSRKELLGSKPTLLKSGKTPEETYRSLHQAMKEGRSWKGEFINRRKNGEEYAEFALISPIRGSDGRITHYVAAKEDITEKKRIGNELDSYRLHLEELVQQRTSQLADAKDAAEAATRAKSAFLANMSHEIRTPMNAILGMAHLLKRTQTSPQQKEFLDRISQSGRHLLSLINDILDLSKIEAGKMVLSDDDVDIAAIPRNVASMISDQARAKGLSVQIETARLPPYLRGDSTRLSQALLNLANNAIKFTQHGSISIRTRVVEETDDGLLLRFEVQDTGIGIAPENMLHLFQAFEQADSSTTRRFGGTGLGLAITRRLAELMGGEANADSEPGVGSTFWFTAHLARSHRQAPNGIQTIVTTPEAETILARDYRGVRLLLVEDEPANQVVAQGLLRSVGLECELAENGAEAVRRIEAGERFQLILMDMQMPEMDGLEATRRIRGLHGGERLPILAMTANAFDEDRERCRGVGMNDFISKPVDPEVMFSTLLRWLPPATMAPAATPLQQTASDADEVMALRTLLRPIDSPALSNAIHMLGDDTQHFSKILQGLAKRHSDDRGKIEKQLGAGNPEGARQIAHSLKGAAGSLGLAKLQNAAAEVELLLKATAGSGMPKQAMLVAAISELGGELERVKAAISCLPEKVADRPAQTLAPGVLAKIKQMLAIDDTMVIDTVHEHEAALRHLFGERWQQFIGQVDGFDFHAAKDILDVAEKEK